MAEFIGQSSSVAFVAADAQKYFVEPLFLGEDVLTKMDVMMDVKGNTYLEHFAAASKVTKADNGGAFSAVAGGEYTNPLISPIRVEVEISMNGGTFFNKVKGQVLRSGTDKDNVDGTILKKIGAEILMQGIQADFNRQVWLADTTSSLGISGDYNVYQGAFQSLIASGCAKTAATYSTASNSAIDALQAVYAQSTAELKELPKTFYVSGKIADDYIADLTAKGVAPAYDDLQNGIPKLSYLGIPIVVRRDWDTALLNDFANITDNTGAAVYTAAAGARIALIADGALVVGTDFGSAAVESWYNRDAKVF